MDKIHKLHDAKCNIPWQEHYTIEQLFSKTASA